MSPAEFQALVRKPNKYGAKAIEVDGIRFPSIGEANRWLALRTLETNGVIQNLKRQVRHRIEANGVRICTYVSDFEYDEAGQHVVEDFKGFRTPAYQIKAKLMLALHGVTIRETGKGRSR
jgi:Protein of unknown function (DUF1064)